jgi:hypothetical protein
MQHQSRLKYPKLEVIGKYLVIGRACPSMKIPKLDRKLLRTPMAGRGKMHSIQVSVSSVKGPDLV